ncbi:MAG TPA: copper transporter, partial [Acidimicrobiales bacterium]|nr:copper transporter [Acidimicrobiales bacterium]
MINFRFHLVSLTAVFLALALGVLMGSTVIERGIVDGLNNRISAISRRADETEAANARLTRDLARRDEVAAAAAPLLIAGRLTDVPVVVVAVRGSDEDQVGALSEVLRQAGASVAGPIWITSRWKLTNREEDVTALAAAAGVPAFGSAVAVRRSGLEALASGITDPGEASTLRALSASRFVDLP